MSFPSSLDSFTTKTDGVDDVDAAWGNSLQAALVAIETELGTDPAGSLTDLKTRLAVALSAAGLLNFKASTGLTIASGAITVTQNWHTVDTQSAASTDDLDTITAGAEGQVLVLRSTADARDIVIRHNVGNVVCAGGQNITLGTNADLVILIYDATLVKWIAFGMTGAGLLNGANVWTGMQTFGAAENHKFTSTNVDITLDATHHIVSVDASGAARTITLPPASGLAGREYVVIKADSSANTVTLDGNAAETINGSATLVISTQYDNARLVCNGTGWFWIG